MSYRPKQYRKRSKTADVPKIKLSEADIQRAILDYISLTPHFAFRVNTQGVPIRDDSGEISGFRPSPMKGIADILVCMSDGRFAAIEVKSAKGKVSEEQMAFLQEVDNRGGLAIIAHSLDDVIRFLV